MHCVCNFFGVWLMGFWSSRSVFRMPKELWVCHPSAAAAAAAAKSLQSCPTLCDPIDSSPPGSPRPWDSPGKNWCKCFVDPYLCGEPDCLPSAHLEDRMLSEISQTQKDKYCLTSLVWRSESSQIHRDRRELGLQGLGGGKKGELILNAYRVSVWDNEKVLEMVMMVSQQYNYT